MASPVRGGDVKKFLRFTNVRERHDEIIILTWMIYSFVPGLPHPILILHRPQGSAKSTTMKRLKAIIDPCAVDDTHTTSEAEFVLAASQNWVVCLDNVSNISPKFSDLLCKVVTGFGFSRRILYTTDEMMYQRFLRNVMINGIGQIIDKPDLFDRTNMIQLERIPNDQRVDEAKLQAEFAIVQGEILGGCFDALAKAMLILPSIPDGIFNTRMLDYARWGCAIAEAIGYSRQEFLEAIENNTRRQNEESLEASPLATVLSSYFSHGAVELKGSATKILRDLRRTLSHSEIESRLIPHTPKLLGKRLVEVRPNLEAEGYAVNFTRGKERIWTIVPPEHNRRLPPLKALPSMASLPSLEPEKIS